MKNINVAQVKKKYPSGTRVVVDGMGEDPRPIRPGTKGTVLLVDDIGTIHCAFDNGRQLGLVPGVDRFYIESPEERKSMKKVMLNKVLFDLILYVQSIKLCRMRETTLFGEKQDDLEYTKRIFFSIPRSVFERAGILQCAYNFRTMLSFKATEEMMNTESKDLDMIETPFWSANNNKMGRNFEERMGKSKHSIQRHEMWRWFSKSSGSYRKA